jgi:mono/diheme cytochrome c family protein
MKCGALFLAICIAPCGCEKSMQNMYDQDKYKSYATAALFPDQKVLRAPLDDTQMFSRGTLAGASSGREGVEAVERSLQAQQAQSNPYPLTRGLLTRGQQRFDVFCAPCHSPLGDGDGLVVRHGYPAPPSFHDARLRAVGDRHLYDVITQGYGTMYAYDDRIAPEDRWAIVAYIRALQLSQYSPLAALTAADRRQLDRPP